MGDSSPVLLLDFDGVLIDSIDECVVSSYNQITGSLCRELAQLPAGYVSLLRLNRSRARKAGEFKRLAAWCLDQIKTGPTDRILSLAEFNALYAGSSESLADLGREFFAVRQKLIDRDPESWCELNPPMQPIWEWLKNHRKNKFTILTYKNLPAVNAICSHFGMPIDPAEIYASDDGTTKAENLEKIIALNGEHRQYHFIDDSLDNLIEMRTAHPAPNLHLYWAGWGFKIEGDDQRAAQEKFAILTQTEAIALIEKLAPGQN